MFLICGSIRAELPYSKVYETREKNRKIGLGLMGVHEWLLKHGKDYEVDDEFKSYLQVYREESERAATSHAERLYCSPPTSFRAIAPAGTIGILASTTTGIEPLYAVAYKRRYLVEGTTWKYQYYIDPTAERILHEGGLDPDSITTAAALARDPERRIKFQYDVQQYVDMGISSTINLPAWGSKYNNEDCVGPFAETLAKYCHGLRGITCYPDNCRGGQPLSVVPYGDAISKRGVIFQENEESCKGGICGI
jgi:ribonucleoside-diphosphate reductase alpha chain